MMGKKRDGDAVQERRRPAVSGVRPSRLRRPEIGRTPDRQPAEAARGATGLDARPSARSTRIYVPNGGLELRPLGSARHALGAKSIAARAGPELSWPRH